MFFQQGYKNSPLFCRLAMGLLLFQVFSAVLLVIFAGVFLQLPARSPEHSDLIVVLGGASMSARLKKGAELYTKGFAPRVLVTGFSEDTSAVVDLHADWRLRYLQSLHIPESAILTDAKARNSWQEAQAVEHLMRSNGWSKVLITSDPPHFFRLSWILGRVLQPSGISYRLISSNPEWWDARFWWQNPISATFVIEELIKLFYYYAKY